MIDRRRAGRQFIAAAVTEKVGRFNEKPRKFMNALRFKTLLLLIGLAS